MSSPPPPRTRLGQLAQRKHLNKSAFVREFEAKARELGLKVGLTESTLKRWYAGQKPLPDSCRVLVHWWKEPIDKLFGPPAEASIEHYGITPRERLVTAGRESSSQALRAAAVVNPQAIKSLRLDTRGAARRYLMTAPEEMLGDFLYLRDEVNEQIALTEKVAQKAELYLLAGAANGLLSVAAWDLGAEDVARRFLNSANLYAENVEVQSLTAWLRALEATVELWSDEPREAIRITTEALEQASAGTARVRLHAIRARALALVGARQEVIMDLGSAVDELDRAGQDEFLDYLGGELGFDRPRQALCAGAAYVALGDGQRAETAALEALELFAAAPESERWSAGALGATIDLGIARTQQDDLAGAEDALLPVFSLDPQWRTEALSRRLTKLSRLLNTQRYAGSLEGGRISDQILVFTAEVQERTGQLSISAGEELR